MNTRDELIQMIWDEAVADRVRGGKSPQTVPVVRPKVEAMADRILAAGYRKPRTIGYVVLDLETKALDWDGELHPTEEAAIESLTGPRQMWCKSVEEETEDRTFWGTAYMICPVEAAA